MELTARRVLLALLVLAALAAGAYGLGRATGGESAPPPPAPRALRSPEALPVPALTPVGALPDMRGG